MNSRTFNKIAESLRQYRRAELKDFEPEVGSNPVDTLYVDPLPDDAVLLTVLSPGTVFLLGRKGTGKSTIFAKAQSEIRKTRDLVSIYIDVKSLYDLISTTEVPIHNLQSEQISKNVYLVHMLRKHFLGAVLANLIGELQEAYDNLSLWDRIIGKRKGFVELVNNLREIEQDVRSAKLSDEEIPILRMITTKSRSRQEQESNTSGRMGTGGTASPLNPSLSFEIAIDDVDKTLDDKELYQEYSDVILRSFPFAQIITKIKELLNEAGLKRLIVFFDDFSELGIINQRLFVDVILAPLNNSSDEYIKFKIAGYPGRVYYGKIDPSKVHTICLDFASIYKSPDVQTMEASAIDYTERLLRRRFIAFGECLDDYFDPATPLEEHIRLIFQVTFNVPRLIGSVLHYCYLDRVSRGLYINQTSIKLASQKYYESVISQYFDRINRFALEPFERKLDRHNQYELLKTIVKEISQLRKNIISGKIGGIYFRDLSNPPTSHFIVSPRLESVLSSLELNFLLTKYNDMRDKNGREVSVYALYYGLCEAEHIAWGYPKGRQYRNFFVQRCFDFNIIIHDFLSKNQTIRCKNCGACYPIEKQEMFEIFKWKCPECEAGRCVIVNLGDDFKLEVEALKTESMLEEVELHILHILSEENRWMRAGEISSLIDVTYQFIGKRTGKLQEMGLVDKREVDGHNRNMITKKALSIYFDN